MPSPETPLTGSCACGTLRIEITAPFLDAGYCHCTRCQRRSGVPWTMNGMVPAEALRVVAGAEAVRTWRPEGGFPKSFCGECGGHVFAGVPGGEGMAGVRFGALHGDPGIAPQWRQWVSSTPAWIEIPDDGLRRIDGSRWA
ncbi:GFA family protein [Capillimicrobium parvum]|uniref:CENP-V/GFA domain-containing protein n=1 Tax=Capillimicrobium parvum TaxID=2884022 RepID=A0A9E6XYJ2_9ACTN|nr:GFA family protein [Capillimicrobium parvum]UGS36830.1 hypothetical protein DSM104329_03241 [Capillimicrobium parvum]